MFIDHAVTFLSLPKVQLLEREKGDSVTIGFSRTVSKEGSD